MLEFRNIGDETNEQLTSQKIAEMQKTKSDLVSNVRNLADKYEELSQWKKNKEGTNALKAADGNNGEAVKALQKRVEMENYREERKKIEEQLRNASDKKR